MHQLVKNYLDKVQIINGKKTIVGDVYVDCLNLTELNFDDIHVTGDFYCSHNKLTTLQGCPISVGGTFSCFVNKLTTLEHCPTSVGDNFRCYGNNLITLEHCPINVSGIFCIDKKHKHLLEQSHNVMLMIINGTNVKYI